MIKLNCITHNKTPITLFYDNLSDTLLNDKKKLIDLSEDDRIIKILKDNTNHVKIKRDKQLSQTLYGKVQNLKVLKIQLGLKCNMKCSYCAQSDRQFETISSNERDVPKFIKMIIDNNITVSDCIQFWGGEPFVYWKILVKLIPELRKLYPEITFAMISNGTLLTKEKLDFLSKYNCCITFSHDGPGYHLRGKDPLDDPKILELWKYAYKVLPHVSINAVLSPANNDVQKLKEFFDEKFKNIDYNLGYEGVMTHVGVINDRLMFNQQTLLKLQKSIFKAITTEPWQKYKTLNDSIVHLLRRWIAKTKKKYSKIYRCDMIMPDTVAVNLKGDVLSCHDHCTPENFVGRIEQLDKVDLSKHFHEAINEKGCKDCLVLGMCRGTCPQISGLAHQLTCKNEFAYNIAIFQAVIWLVFGYTIESYEVV